MPMDTKIGKTTLRLVTGDIADQDTDAVVTAAHWRLNKGTGTDGTIHTKGGPRIDEECRRIGGCPIGDAVITTGGDLRARHVIHAVGPVWRGGEEHEPELLASAYRRSLAVAVQQGLRSISFPSLSTGAFVYPLRLERIAGGCSGVTAMGETVLTVLGRDRSQCRADRVPQRLGRPRLRPAPPAARSRG